MTDTVTPAEGSDTGPEDDSRYARPFADWLQEQQNGRSHTELSDGLHDLIAAVQDTGRAGSITFTVKVKPLSKGDHTTVVISDTVAVKKPAADRAETVFFIDAAGNPSRSDPRQMRLPLREAPRPDTTTAKEIAR